MENKYLKRIVIINIGLMITYVTIGFLIVHYTKQSQITQNFPSMIDISKPDPNLSLKIYYSNMIGVGEFIVHFLWTIHIAILLLIALFKKMQKLPTKQFLAMTFLMFLLGILVFFFAFISCYDRSCPW